MDIFEKIKVVVFDVDGVLSDGKYVVSSDGTISKSFYTRDFYGMEQLFRNDIKVVIISRSKDGVILKKIHDLISNNHVWGEAYANMNLNCYQDCRNKRDIINKYLIIQKLDWENVAYMGDAENDFECLKLAAFSGCPSDAIEEVKELVQYPSDYKGGNGAVYDFCKYILKMKKEKK